MATTARGRAVVVCGNAGFRGAADVRRHGIQRYHSRSDRCRDDGRPAVRCHGSATVTDLAGNPVQAPTNAQAFLGCGDPPSPPVITTTAARILKPRTHMLACGHVRQRYRPHPSQRLCDRRHLYGARHDLVVHRHVAVRREYDRRDRGRRRGQPIGANRHHRHIHPGHAGYGYKRHRGAATHSVGNTRLVQRPAGHGAKTCGRQLLRKPVRGK